MRRAALLLLILVACGPYPRSWRPGHAGGPGSPGTSGAGAAGSGGLAPGGSGLGGSGGSSAPGGAGGAELDACRRAASGKGCCEDGDCPRGSTCSFDANLCTSAPGRCVPCSVDRPYPYCRCDGTVIEGCSIPSLTYWTTCGYEPGTFFCGDQACSKDGQACLIDGDTYRCVPEPGVCKGPDCATMAATALCPSGAFGRSNGQDVYVYCN